MLSNNILTIPAERVDGNTLSPLAAKIGSAGSISKKPFAANHRKKIFICTTTKRRDDIANPLPFKLSKYSTNSSVPTFLNSKPRFNIHPINSPKLLLTES